MIPVMTSGLRVEFERWSVNRHPTFEAGLIAAQREIEKKIYGWPPSTDQSAPERLAVELFKKYFPSADSETSLALELCLCARLALEVPRLVAKEDFPESILSYYPPTFARMSGDIERWGLGEKNSLLAKYIRFLAIASVPCGAETIDLRSRIPVSSVVLSLFRMKDLRPMKKLLSCGLFGIWLRAHLDTSCLSEFNRSGVDQFYFRVAELLRRRADLKGFVSTSWFRDPEVGKISPRLGYLYSDPVSRGAVVMKHRMTSFDIENATKTSATRRRLYEEGVYHPISYTLIWPRKELIAWSDTAGVRKE